MTIGPRCPAATSSRSAVKRGVTLVELMIVVTALGLIAGVTALVMPEKHVPPDDTAHRVADARTKALRSGRPVTVVLQLDTTFGIATAMPDGSVLADSAAQVVRLTGQVRPTLDTASIGANR